MCQKYKLELFSTDIWDFHLHIHSSGHLAVLVTVLAVLDCLSIYKYCLVMSVVRYLVIQSLYYYTDSLLISILGQALS